MEGQECWRFLQDAVVWRADHLSESHLVGWLTVWALATGCLGSSLSFCLLLADLAK